MDLLLTNSHNTRKRIKTYLGLDAKVLYPPVDTSRFVHLWQKNYFLSFARLADAKRVDLIAEAFSLMSDQKLIIIYGKNDPQKNKILNFSKDYPNIHCTTLENNDDLYEYIGNAIATIYVPIDEDFWMSSVESMSAGKPVIWVNSWGLKETIIDGKTGTLLPEWFTPQDIVDVVKSYSPDYAASMRKDCETQAQKFSMEQFEKDLNTLIQ